MNFWEIYFKVKMWFVSWKCFFVGHAERAGYPENYQPPYCDRCLSEYPEDMYTLASMMNDLKEIVETFY